MDGIDALTAEAVAEIIVDAEEIGRRHGLIREQMRLEGIDTLLIYATALRPFGVHYASNYDLIGEGALVIISDHAEPKLIVSELWDLERARLVSPIADIAQENDMATYCGRLLAKDRTGIAGLEWVGSAFNARLVEAAGGQVKNCSRLLERAASLKTPLERELIRQAAYLADIGFEHGYRMLRRGLREFELAAEIEYAMRAAGAVDNFGLLSSGKHNRAIGLPTDKAVEEGDLLIFEITPARLSRNYSAQLCRTMSMGRGSKVAHEKYKVIEEALEEGLRAVKPGAPASDIVIAQDNVISRYGYGDYCRPPYMRARGHGFGLGRIDLARGNTQVLEPNMAMIVHPNQYFPELGYLALGEMVLVTETGVERLCRLRPGIYECD